jgi:hypothetical protein
MASTDDKTDQDQDESPSAGEGNSPSADLEPQPAEMVPVQAVQASAPHFTSHFPDDPELQALVRAFEDGRYAHVRRYAPELAAKTDDPKIAEAALELRRRLDPDPLARNLLLAAIALLVVLAVWSFQHQH